MPENNELSKCEIHDSGKRKGKQVTENYIPSQHSLYQKEQTHFYQEHSRTGKIIRQKMAEKRKDATVRDARLPDEKIAVQEIDQHGAFEGDYRRDHIYSQIMLEKEMRTGPKHRGIYHSPKHI